MIIGLPNLETHQRSSSNETRHIGDSITWFCFQLHDKEEYIEQYTWLKVNHITFLMDLMTDIDNIFYLRLYLF